MAIKHHPDPDQLSPEAASRFKAEHDAAAAQLEAERQERIRKFQQQVANHESTDAVRRRESDQHLRIVIDGENHGRKWGESKASLDQVRQACRACSSDAGRGDSAIAACATIGIPLGIGRIFKTDTESMLFAQGALKGAASVWSKAVTNNPSLRG